LILASPHHARTARITHVESKIRRQIVRHGDLQTGSGIGNIADGTFDCRTIAASDNAC
jgi:hypothetical protein